VGCLSRAIEKQGAIEWMDEQAIGVFDPVE
jgi:hypothetical protein